MTEPFSSPRPTPPIENGRYKLPDPNRPKTVRYTRVTTFTKTIADNYNLERYQQRNVALGMSRRPDLVAKAAALTAQDRNDLQRVADSAQEAAGSSSGANWGTGLHGLFDQAVMAGTVPQYTPAEVRGDVEAWLRLYEKMDFETPSGMSEVVCVNPTWHVAGQLDRMVGFRRHRYILDFKTGSSVDYSWGEFEAQLYLYASSPYIWNGEEDPEEYAFAYNPMPDVSQALGIIVHIPVGSGQARMLPADLQAGRRWAGLCQQVRDQRRAKSPEPYAIV